MNQKLKRILSVFLACAITIAFVPQERLAPNLTNAYAFTDIAGHPSELAVMRWAQLGVVEGDGGLVYPDRAATRVEFIAAMNRVLRVAVNKRSQAFDDVSRDSWYFEDVQKAYAAGLTIGIGNDKFAPNQPLNREMMVTMMGRIFGLYSENTSILADIYADETQATYGRVYLAAFAEMGVTMAVDGNFEPLRTVTRAEMFQFINDFLPHVYTGTDEYSGRSTTGNVIIRSPGVTIDSMKLDGSLILADGIEDGNISIKNSVINGKLIIRGGGPNSVNLTGTTVTEGVYLYNPYCKTRIYSTNNQTKIGEITAMTSVTLEGAGFSSLRIPRNAVDSSYTLRDVVLDSVNVEKPNTNITLEGVIVDNVRFSGTAIESTLDIAKEASVNYLELNADGITVTGEGSIDYLVIKGDGANVSIKPRFVSIAPGLTAIVAGKEIKGSEVEAKGTASNVKRETVEMEVKRDAANTGGTALTLKTTSESMKNLVTITPDATAVQLTDQTRLGYWIGFMVPAPAKALDPIVKIGYDFEGGDDYIYSVPFVSQSSVKGILVYIPVKAAANLTGSIDTTLYITWGNGLYETLSFKGSNFKLAQPTGVQVTKMVNQFGNTNYPSYNKIATFTGSEALKRLLLADNPLGLDIRSFDVFSEADKNSFVADMYASRTSLTSKQAIQAYLNERITSIGGLYAANAAMTAAAMQKVIEDEDFAGQLGINTLSDSDYGTLSDYGRLNVANTLVVERNKLAGGKFANEEEFAKAFEKAVADRRRLEITLLTTINGTSDGTAMQKLLENKTNADIIGIVTASDPYKAYSAAQKLSVANKIVAGRQYTNLNEVRKIFEGLVGTPDNPIVIPPEDNPNILGVDLNVTSMTLVRGYSENIVPTIRTTTGSYSTLSSVTFTSNSASVGVGDDGTVKGNEVIKKATITVASKVDPKKKNTVTVAVVAPVTITALEISPPSVNVNSGSTVQLALKVTPATGNDKIEWSSDNTNVATVSNGVVTGVEPGSTTIMARTASGVYATCKVYVSTDYESVTIEKPRDGEITIGLDGTYKLSATVSPVTQSNKRINWTSNAPTVAKVGADGTVTGVGYGEAWITATSEASGAKDEIKVIVKEGKYGVILSESEISMFKNGIYKLSATVLPKNTDRRDGDILWDVMDGRTDIVKVDQNGVVTAVGPGTAYVVGSYVSDPEGKAYDTCKVTVSPDELKVTVKIDGAVYNPAKPPSINAGQQLSIQVEFTPVPSNKNITYTSNNELIATVDKSGIIKGTGDGTAIIYVTPEANNTAIPITVKVARVALKGISITPSNDKGELTVNRNSYTELKVIFNPPDATNKKILWGSDAPGIVQVTYDEKDTSVAWIYAIESTYTTATESGIVPDEERRNLPADDPRYDPRATMTGVISTTTNKPVTITARSEDGSYVAKCYVTVNAKSGMGEVETVEIRLTQWVFQLGTSQQLLVDFNKANPDKQPTNIGVSWSSSAPDVADVDRNGILHTYRAGVTKITVTSQDGSKQNTKMVVVAPVGVGHIDLTGLDTRTQYGKWIQMTPKSGFNTKKVTASVYEKATDKSLMWTSSDKNVVQVDANGNLTAIKSGVAVITVRAVSEETYGTAYPNDSSVVKTFRNEMILKESGGKFYSPNKDIDGNDVEVSLNTEIPLVVNKPVEETFTVWVTDIELEGAAFQNMPEFWENKSVTVSAYVVPGGAKVDKVDWIITDRATNATVSGISSPANGVNSQGTTSFTFIPPANSTSLFIECKVTMNELKQATIYDSTTNAWKGARTDSTEVTVNSKSYTASQTVTVKSVAATGISGITVATRGSIVPVDESKLVEGAKYDLYATISPDTATNKLINWTSSDPTIATVSPQATEKGELEALKEGTVTITATSNGNTAHKSTVTLKISTTTSIGSASFEIVPLPQTAAYALNEEEEAVAPTYIKIRSSAKVLAGKSITLYPYLKPTNANQLVWETSDSNIADVNGDGVVTGNSAGRVTITAKSAVNGNIKSSCTVQVVASNPRPSTNFKLSRTKLTLNQGNSYTLDTVISPSNVLMTGVSWYSSRPEVATVDTGGTVTGVSDGVCTITAVTDDGRIARCTVTIRVKVTSVKISADDLTLKVGEDQKLSASVLPENASTNVITWKSSNNRIASVSADGTVWAYKKGTVTITASCDGRSATCTVTVTN